MYIVLGVLVAIVFIVLIRYLWWLDSYGDVNPYMGRGESQNTTPLTSDEAKGEVEEGETKATSSLDQQPSFLQEPEGEKDDLKLIHGIGPKIEEKLNLLGIFHYSQIAAFSADEIKWVDDHLSFHGRIERDDWMGQAQKLINGEAS